MKRMQIAVQENFLKGYKAYKWLIIVCVPNICRCDCRTKKMDEKRTSSAIFFYQILLKILFSLFWIFFKKSRLYKKFKIFIVLNLLKVPKWNLPIAVFTSTIRFSLKMCTTVKYDKKILTFYNKILNHKHGLCGKEDV